MFDVGLEQLTDDELIAELRKRFHSIVFAGLKPDQLETIYVLGGQKLTCVGLAGTLQSNCTRAELE